MGRKKGGKNKKQVPLSEESRKKVDQGLKEAREGKTIRVDNVDKFLDNLDNKKLPLTKEQQERKERLNNTLRELNKSLGKDTVKYADAMEVRTRIPFKQKCLNKLTGGGVVKGLHTIIWGSKGSAKSTVVLDLIAQAQKLGNQCVYINGEHSYDPIYAKKRGVDTESLVIEEVKKLEDGLDTVIKLCRDNVVDLIIFDSIHGLAPKAEIYAGKGEKEKSTADSNMALRARAMTQYFEMGTADVSKAKCAVVLIAQSRMDLGAFVKLETLTGGHALLHNSRLTLRFRRGQGADAPTEKRETEEIDEKGHKVKETIKLGFDLVVHVDKAQIEGCTEGDEIHVPFYFKEGIKEDK